MDNNPPPILSKPDAGMVKLLIIPFINNAIPPPNNPAPAVKIEIHTPNITARIPAKTPKIPPPTPKIKGERNITSMMISAQLPAPLFL